MTALPQARSQARTQARTQVGGVVGGGSAPSVTPIAAYSFVAVNPSATRIGRVRRSSDNTESDYLTIAEAVTFCGANNGFITSAYDQYGTNHATQATTTQQPRVVSSGVSAGGWLFDGSNDDVRSGSNLGFTSAAPWTITGWVKHSARPASDYQAIFGTGAAGVGQAAEYLVDASGILYVHTIGGLDSTTHTLALNTWTHIAIVWNGTAFLTYINATLVRTWTVASALISGVLLIGRSVGGSRYFNGLLYYVDAHDSALDVTDIATVRDSVTPP